MSRFRWSIATVLLSLLLGLTVYGCGSSSRNFNAGSGQIGVGGSGLPVAGETRYGRILVVPNGVIFDTAAQAEVRASRERIKALGLTASEEGDLVIWPSSPGSAWLVKCGDQQVVAGPDGDFHLRVPDDVDTPVTFCHPNDENIVTTASLLQLSPRPEAPKLLGIPIGFDGPCGMSPGDVDEEFCRGNDPGEARANLVSGRYIPPDWGGPSRGNVNYGVIRKPLGTYPPDKKFINLNCPDFDGFGPFNYFASICNFNVLDGACPNENQLADEQYRLFAAVHGKLPRSEVTLLDYVGILSVIYSDPVEPEFLTPPLSITPSRIDLDCEDNHKGRACGYFFLGDVSLLADGQIIATGNSGTLSVLPGQKGSFTVHNNGVFGYTIVRQAEESRIALSSDHFDVQQVSRVRRLRHFRTKGILNIYETDQVVNFEVPEDLQDGEIESVTFEVDNREVTLNFEVRALAIEPPSAAIGPEGTQEFTVIVPGVP